MRHSFVIVRPFASSERSWKKGEEPCNRKDITIGLEMTDKLKVISSRSGHEHGGNPGPEGKRRVLSKIEILAPETMWLILDMNIRWSDEMFCKRYGLAEYEISLIESNIRSMEPNDD